MKGLSALLSFAAIAQATDSFAAIGKPESQNVLQDHHVAQQHSSSRPNIVFILVDDQDLQMDSLRYTPRINHYLADQGVFYRNHFVTTALCCPSRVSLWTGKQAHNTNVTEIYPPYGGYPKFIEEGHNENWLPLWLQAANYTTYYTGKLFNAHTVDNYNAPFVTGFNASDFLLDPYTYQYLRPHYQRNHDAPTSYEGEHTMDILTKKALGFLDDAISSNDNNPFFLTIAPVAPHSNLNMTDETDTTTFRFSPPIPLDKHKHLFPDAKIPRTPNFNPDHPTGVSWIKSLPQQDVESIAYNDEFYRERLRALQGVDELVEKIVLRLEDAGILENTYIFYTSDNGYHIGQHRLHPGKECGFDEDIRVPMFVRGPGVPRGVEVSAVTTHVDLAPTILGIVGGSHAKGELDGVAIPLTEEEITAADVDGGRHEHVNVEYWGVAGFEGAFGRDENGGPATFTNNTYKALRLISPDFNLYYSVWCSGEHELYDLTTDPYQLHNLYPNLAVSKIGSYSAVKISTRLDALLMVLKSCRGETCIHPWRTLHPDGDVNSLRDALDDTFDGFYVRQVRVQFGWCERGYLIEAEGPQVPVAYYGSTRWSDWV
ncbi:extracellular sulfatase Sulf-1 [Aspergillus brasiliensis]|uniref:Arylsulfatase n=1 Tax=Aspergillus brasiliensis TaxID=319629 RepID=A0A9W5YJV4_9EURO|nr:extracellular sulfatase Sulf-1 [Aspergillus brasiliensis]GKZ48327.1 extracellular sulfatase Sulf-1 [Aspergillus brasiliensis]